jgi:hypothetical protein
VSPRPGTTTPPVSVSEFCARFEPAAPDVAARTLLLADVLLAGPRYGFGEPESLRAVPFGWRLGVCGVGALLVDGQLSPAVFFTGMAPGETGLLDEVERLRSAIADLLGAAPPWLDGVRVVGTEPFVPHRSVGDAILGAKPGSAGGCVRWSSRVGFLTAGHVGGTVFSPAYSGTARIGTVVYSNDPSHHGTQVEEDVALVELAPGFSMRNPFARSSSGKPGGSVSVIAHHGFSPTALRAYCPWLFNPTLNGTWGDVYLTTAVVTLSGDSGAPVADGAGDVLGHVVGELAGLGTVVQDINYQLCRIRRQPQFSGIRI